MANDYRKMSVAFGLCVAALLCVGRAHAEGSAADKAAAEALFDRGLALMRDGKYQEACQRLEQSQAVERGIGTMLYLAECYEKSGRTASAWALFREASSWAQAAGQSDRAEAGKRRAERLEKTLSHVTIRVVATGRADGLELKDNGAPVHPSVWGVSIPVDPGVHKVEARAKGHKSWSGEVTVADRGGSAEIEVPPLEPLPQAVAQVPPSPAVTASAGADAAKGPASTAPVDHGMPAQRIAALAVGGAGVVGLVIGAAFGIRAINKNDSAKDHGCSGTTCDTKQGVTLSNQAMTAARASNALLAVGGVLVVGGIVTFFTAPKSRKADVALQVDRHTAGFRVGGVF